MYICLHVDVNGVFHIEEKHGMVAFDNRIVRSIFRPKCRKYSEAGKNNIMRSCMVYTP